VSPGNVRKTDVENTAKSTAGFDFITSTRRCRQVVASASSPSKNTTYFPRLAASPALRHADATRRGRCFSSVAFVRRGPRSPQSA